RHCAQRYYRCRCFPRSGVRNHPAYPAWRHAMMSVFLNIALHHLLARKRQTLVSLLGIALGTAVFLGISAMMQGSETDFIHRLIDNSPHITIQDQYRNSQIQPIARLYPDAVVQMHRVKPETETRGIRNYK